MSFFSLARLTPIGRVTVLAGELVGRQSARSIAARFQDAREIAAGFKSLAGLKKWVKVGVDFASILPAK